MVYGIIDPGICYNQLLIMILRFFEIKMTLQVKITKYKVSFLNDFGYVPFFETSRTTSCIKIGFFGTDLVEVFPLFTSCDWSHSMVSFSLIVLKNELI